MVIDKFGNNIYENKDIIDILYKNKDYIKDVLVIHNTETKKLEEFSEIKLKFYDKRIEDIDIKEFDTICQDDWFIPEEYKNFDIEHYLMTKCQTNTEQNRVLEELKAYKEKNMIIILKTLKYIVDVMRENKVLWGVGRGSSVASYVLYLIGVHKIDSIKYDLDWREFLR